MPFLTKPSKTKTLKKTPKNLNTPYKSKASSLK